MSDRHRPETTAGRAFASETKGVTRSLIASAAAQKGAATRRKNKVAEREEFRRNWFTVIQQSAVGNDHVESYPTEGEYAKTLDAIIAEWESPDLWAATYEEDQAESCREMRDLTVWRDGYLLAVLKKRGERFEAIRFDT